MIYEPLASILPLHFPCLREQVWHKFHGSRTTYIKVTEQNAFKLFENIPRDITPRALGLGRYSVTTPYLP